MTTSAMKTPAALISMIALLAASGSARASDVQTSFDLGVAMLPQATTGNISQSSYVMHFQAEHREYWVRPIMGGMLEMNPGSNLMLHGAVLGGLELIAGTAAYIKPFIEADGAFGWTFLHMPTQTFVGLMYGAIISAGTEIRLSSKDNSNALRISSGWRVLSGTVGPITGADLGAVIIQGGLTF